MQEDIIKPFVEEVIAMVTNYPEDITEQVLCRIANEASLKERYEELAATHGKDPVNQAIGKMVREVTGLRAVSRRTSRSGIADSYSVLSR